MRIYVAGHTGMLGSAIVRALHARGYGDIVTRIHEQRDLCNPLDVNSIFSRFNLDYVFMAAGKVGGIQANLDNPAAFLHDNALMALNVINACKEYGARLCYVGSSCMYPVTVSQPMSEDFCFTGPLAGSNEGYALGKWVGVKYAGYLMPDTSVCPLPCNLYGHNDHYGENGHVLASLVRRFVDAVDNGLPAITLWGNGKAKREFLFVDDCADALVFLMERGEKGIINVGSNDDISISMLAELIAREVGYTGQILWDTSKPSGVPRKLMNSNRLHAMGWSPKVDLRTGIQRTIVEYRSLKEAEVV